MTPDTITTAPQPLHEDGLEGLREIRRQFAAECNYDPYEMGRRIRARQKEHPERIYRTKRVLAPVEQFAASSVP